jgi:hypothetical protein
MSFRQDRTNPSTAVSNWHGRSETPKGWPSTQVSTWMNGGLFGAGGGGPVYEPIGTYTFDGTATTHTFSSIPQTYQDLRVVCKMFPDTSHNASGAICIRVNGESGSNYTFASTYQYNGTNSSSGSGASSTRWDIIKDIPSQYYANSVIADVINYTSGTNQPYFQSIWGITPTTNSTYNRVGMVKGEYANGVPAVTQIEFYINTGDNFANGTNVTLYGIGTS